VRPTAPSQFLACSRSFFAPDSHALFQLSFSFFCSPQIEIVNRRAKNGLFPALPSKETTTVRSSLFFLLQQPTRDFSVSNTSKIFEDLS